jgi:hypothetical protein
MEPLSFDVLDTVFPIIARDPQQPGQAAPPEFFETAFAIAPGVSMTAGHVVSAASEHGQVAIAGPIVGQPMLGSAAVQHFEMFENHDIALLFVQQAKSQY